MRSLFVILAASVVLVCGNFVVSDSSDSLDSSAASAAAYALPLAGHSRSRVFPTTTQYGDACATGRVETNASRVNVVSGAARRYFDVRPIGPVPGAVLYSAVERNTGTPVLFKSLATSTPVASFQQQLLVLAQIADLPDVQRLHDVLLDATHELAPTLVFERPDHDMPLAVLARISLADVRRFGARLLRLLDAIHSRCIIHGSLSVANVLISLASHSLTVTGWPTAVHYLPKEKRELVLDDLAAAAPEMLFGMRGYNYAVDLWSLGVVLLEMLTGKRLFVPSSAREQASLVAQVVGKAEFDKCVAKDKSPLDPDWAAERHATAPVDLRALVAKSGRHPAADCADLLELISQMLAIDPENRPTAQQVLQSAAWSNTR